MNVSSPLPAYPKIGQFKSADDLRMRLQELQLDLPVDNEILTGENGSPLNLSLQIGTFQVGNRWCIHPMEGWDATRNGSPSDLTLRRWRNFGLSGAKLIWGGEAAAVQPDGRANPNQTLAIESNRAGLIQLLRELHDAHRASFESAHDLLVGLQLTHSGRFCRPNDKRLEPRIAYHHPLLDAKFGIDPTNDSVVWTDDELEMLIDSYVAAARLALAVGFQFVDVKACHGYLLHEFLSARRRPGRFGGDLDGRSLILRTIVDRIHNECPNLMVGVRLSIFDSPPFVGGDSVGSPMDFSSWLPYEFGFGVAPTNPLAIDLSEPFQLIENLRKIGVVAINISAGSPYYNPHLQRPAIFPPSDGYLPPEDPLVGVVRQIQAARKCKARFPELPMIGTGYSYLQDYLPHVAQAVVREGWIDSVGIGRLVLSYPDFPIDQLRTGATQRKRICRTFSDCTTAPRNGLVSGCYPLDPFYKKLPQAEELRKIKGKAPA